MGSPVTTLAYQSEVKPSASARSAWATTLSTVVPPPVNPMRIDLLPCRMPYARATLYKRTAGGTIVSLTATKLTPTVGAEITGLSGRELVDPIVAADMEAMLDRYGVVVIRDAHVDDVDLVAFSRQLGDLVVASTGEHELAE